MTTDNRTNEPTPEQVEAAYRAWITFPHKRGPQNAENAIRAALVAAQGVFLSEDVRALAEAEVRKTPAEGNPISEPGVTKDIAFVRGAVFGAAAGAAPQAEMPGRQELGQTIRNKFNEARGRSGVDPWALADLILEEHPALAAPVLPSSTVDEDALAEVICLALNHRDGGDECEDDYRVARAVGEWLKEQGR